MSVAVVVDTDVFSFVYKGDSRATLYTPHLAGNPLHLAFGTVAELYRWAFRHAWGQVQIDDLRATIGRYTILDSDDATHGNGAGSCPSEVGRWDKAMHG